FGRHHEDSFQPGIKLPVHQRHLQLVLVITDSPNASQNCLRLLACGIVHQQAREAVYLHVRLALHAFPEHLESLIEREQRGLLGVSQDRDDKLVENLSPSMDKVEVAVCGRIETARVNGDNSLQKSPVK